MSKKTYRVIQWATGTIGKVALRQFVENPAFELVGVYVTNPEKVGKDAGDFIGAPPTGVIATNDADAILALKADCVHFSPLVADVEMVCRLLRSGKNVVSPLGPFFPIERYRADWEKITAAAKDGGVSFHGSGIQPGYAGDILPLTLTRLSARIDQVRVYEIVDFSKEPQHWIEMMGFGRDLEEVKAKPSRSPEAGYYLSQSMAMVATALGVPIDDITTEIQLAAATRDIVYPTGVIRSGTVAGQHYEWTGWVDGAPMFKIFAIWTMGRDMEPHWGYEDSLYRIEIDGDPSFALSLDGGFDSTGRKRHFPGMDWTALLGVTAIPDVCEAVPGFVTHLDLGVVRPRGLVRPAAVGA